MGLEELRRQYDVNNLQSQLAAERALLAASFTRATQHKALLGGGYKKLAAIYRDAEAVFGMGEEPLAERKPVLYALYDRYFALLSPLPFRARVAIGVDKDLKALKKILKTGGPDKNAPRLWQPAVVQLGIPCVAFFACELLWTGTWDNPAAPAWLGTVYLLGFLGFFAVYTVNACRMNGLLHHMVLHKWLRFKADPETEGRPADLLQYIKMAIPLLVAFGSAMIKLYFQ